MQTLNFVQSVSTVLLPLADPQRAEGMKAYMRGQFDFLGIQTPLRRQATAAILKPPCSPETLITHAADLWKQPQREFQYVAVDLLSKHARHLSLAQLDAILALAQRRSWWDTVDGLAMITGRLIRAARALDPSAQRHMDNALHHPDLWIRRIAMLHQIGWREETDTERLFTYAETLAKEQDFFIRKAIGWALRDHARHAPSAVRDFLARSTHILSALSIREAGKHLQ